MSGPQSGLEGRAFALRVSVLFAAIFTVAGINLPNLPLWLDWAGLTSSEIAIITAAPLIVRIGVTPGIAFAADRAGDHRRFLIALAWGGLVALVALALSRGFWPILACTLLFALAWTTIMPLTETIAMSGVKAAGLDYGRMRVWGSLSFVAASFGGGWVIERLGASSAIWLVVLGGALTMLAAHGLAHPIGLGRLRAATSPPRLRLADAAGLLSSRPFLIFLLAVGAVQAAHAMFYTFGTLHWRALGLSAGVCGLLWAIGVIVEITLFAYSGALLRRVGVAELLVLAAIAAVVRWTAMAFDPPLWLLVPLQALHGLTFGGAHIGAIHFMGQVVPGRHGAGALCLRHRRHCAGRRHAPRRAPLCGIRGPRLLCHGGDRWCRARRQPRSAAHLAAHAPQQVRFGLNDGGRPRCCQPKR
jgi:MFS transporter, PPP family, 3-phenylpropionic acid transporter